MSSDSGPSHLQGLLKECNGSGADYLFQQDKPYDVSYDTGDKSIQCGRHVDAFKLWLMWKAKVQSNGFTAIHAREHAHEFQINK